jgi:hypothetical protein
MTSRTPHVFRAWSIAASLALSAVSVPGQSDLSAQTGTVHVQASLVSDAAATYTLGVRYTTPRSEPEVPGRGQTSVEAVNEWLFTATLGGGLSRGRGTFTKNQGTVNGQLGMMYRTGKTVDQVGLVVHGNLNPGYLGPALRVKIAIVDLLVGGMWVENDVGFRAFFGGGVSWAFLCDVFC